MDNGMFPTPSHRRSIKLETFLFGADYSPEQGAAQDWQEDPHRMAAASVNVVRLADGAWPMVEPQEGRYDFSFFHQQVSRLGELGIQTILCAPVSVPPAWLIAQHPNVLRLDAQGRPASGGKASDCCSLSPTLADLGRRVVAAMAGSFAQSEHVIGWELAGGIDESFAPCFCESCQQAFRQWLRRKYNDDFSALCAAWGDQPGCQAHGGFDQVPLPRGTEGGNPSHLLDHYRFISYSACGLLGRQAQVIRQANPRWFVTHGQASPLVDYARLSRQLDFAGVDIWPGLEVNPHRWACQADLARSAGGNFLVPRMQAGAVSLSGEPVPAPPPDQMRLWAYQAIAHGADGLLHSPWRSGRPDTQPYRQGVLDQDNQPSRRYEEFSREGNELRHIGFEILGTTLDIAAGVLVSCEQEQAHRALNLHLPSPRQQAQLAHQCLWRGHYPVGFVDANDSFAGLGLLVLPGFAVMGRDPAERLGEFVRGGGTLLITPPCGTRDEGNRLVGATAPGLLAELVGATVEESGPAADDASAIDLPGGKSIQSGHWCELLKCTTAKPLGAWRSGHLAGQPAVTFNTLGSGHVLYAGTFLDPANAGGIMELALARSGIDPVVSGLPEDVEIVRRWSPRRTLLFLLNHSDQPQKIGRLPASRDLLSGASVFGEMTLDPYEVAILKSDRR